MATLVSLERVTKEFGGTRAVDDLSLSVAGGVIFCLLGPSGSGKTTTIRLMIGVYAPSKGVVKVLDEAPTSWRTRTREAIGYMPQIPFLYPTLSVSENLNFAASLYGLGWLSRRGRLRELLQIVELWEQRGKLVSHLSGGMRKRLSLACAMVQNPSLVFLDEPTAGIDPILRQRFWEYFRKLRDEGKTLLVTSHYVGEAEYCDEVGIVNEGRLIARGTPLELRRQSLGGDAVDIVTGGLTRDVLRALTQVAGVSGVEPRSFTSVRVFVGDAGKAVPRLIEACRDQTVDVAAINQYHPSFDEVFANLVEKAAQ